MKRNSASPETSPPSATSGDNDQGHDPDFAPGFLPLALREHWAVSTTATAGIALAVGYFGETWFGMELPVSLGFYVFSCLAGGYDAFRKALAALLRGKFDIDLLMVAAAAGAAVLGEWAEGAFLLFLFSLGHAGEHYAMDRARNAVGVLGKLMPRTAFVKRGDGLEEVPVEALVIDETVLVKPGERIPVDGVIAAGESSIDQSAITGESVPVSRKAGDEVFAGTINQDNALDVRMIRLARDNTLNRVMQLVAEAQEQKSPAQRFTDTFARRFVPAVLVDTLLLIVILPLGFGWAWSDAFYRGMLLLVAASPCALAIGTPAAVLAGIAQAARHGVLIKGGVHLENLGRLNTVALDKTGTLTTGRFAVTRVIGLEGTTEDEVLRIAAAVEEQSSHPLAVAIVAMAKARGIEFPLADGIENLAGRGIQARVGDAQVLIGALRAFAGDPATNAGQPLIATVARLEAEGQTTVMIRREGAFIGIIALADEPRPQVREVIERLRAQGIQRLIMLTGDNALVARRVANQIGLTEVRAELLSASKLDLVHELEQGSGVIAMIGDGVNDAPALAAATVGVAMGAGGTAVALETADVVLMGDDLGKLPYVIGLSRASSRVIRQNLSIALGVIFLLVVASLSGLIPLGATVVIHEGSTLLVVLNALRLLAWHESGTGIFLPQRNRS
jgi:Cd2+/Zn2+-exporting ATPase